MNETSPNSENGRRIRFVILILLTSLGLVILSMPVIRPSQRHETVRQVPNLLAVL